MPTLDQQIAAFTARHGWPIEKGQREAERQITNAVQDALRGDLAALSRVAPELGELAQREFEERVRAGEAASNVVFYDAVSGLAA